MLIADMLNLCNIFSDYNAFRGSLKSALHRTFLTTKDTKGAQRPQSLNPGAQQFKPARSRPDMSEVTLNPL